MERACPPRPEGKPSNWWCKEREPWKRIGARATETTAAARGDAALRAVYAIVGASLAALGQRVPPMIDLDSLAPRLLDHAGCPASTDQ
jgi:hypothetical protein